MKTFAPQPPAAYSIVHDWAPNALLASSVVHEPSGLESLGGSSRLVNNATRFYCYGCYQQNCFSFSHTGKRSGTSKIEICHSTNKIVFSASYISSPYTGGYNIYKDGIIPMTN